MLRVLDRYIVRETLQTWLAVSLVLLLILLSNRLARYLSEAVAGSIDGALVFHLLALKAIAFLSLLLPVSLYLAFMLAFGRLYRDSEMAALAACGVGPARLYRSLMYVAVPVTALVAALAFWVGPWAAMKGGEVRARAEHQVETAAFSPGRFREIAAGNGIVYVEKVDPDKRRIDNVFVYLNHRGKPVLLSSAGGTQRIDPQNNDRFLVFTDGHRYEGDPAEPGFKITQFREYALLIAQEDPLAKLERDRASIPTVELLDSSKPELAAEWQWRLSYPLSVLVLTLLALPVAKAGPRQGRYGKVVIAVLIYIVYSNLLGIGRVWIENGKVSPALGLWWVHGLALLVVGLWLLRMQGMRWSLQALRVGVRLARAG